MDITTDIIADNTLAHHRKRAITVHLQAEGHSLGQHEVHAGELQPGRVITIDIRANGWQVDNYQFSYEEDVDGQGQWLAHSGQIWDAGPGYFWDVVSIQWVPSRKGAEDEGGRSPARCA